MRLALISDVHSNATALRTVLERIQEDAPDQVVCVGDVVGYGPSPAESLSLVSEHADVVVQGNHDRNAAAPERYGHHPTAGPGLAHTAEQLSDEQLDRLSALPERTELADGSVLVVHSHPQPEKRDLHVYPEEFPTLAELVDSRFLIVGHTHVQAATEADGTLVVNPGSVGQPRDGDPDAAYAILDTDAAEVELNRVPYDLDAVRERVEAAGLPDRTWERLHDGE